MNEILCQLSARKSVRAFTQEPVTKEEKQLIYQAACQAPSAGNQQLYTIVDVTDPELKTQLSELCDHQPMIARAPMAAVFLADCRKWLESYRAAGLEPRAPGQGDLMLAVSDATIAAQNAVVAAQSLGIGSCYIGDVMERCEAMRELLHLPAYVFPCCMLIFGRPTAQQLERKKPPRAALEHIVHENAYRSMDALELRAMHTEQQQRGGKTDFDYDGWMTAFWKRKYESDFSREMSRSVAKYLRDFEQTELGEID